MMILIKFFLLLSFFTFCQGTYVNIKSHRFIFIHFELMMFSVPGSVTAYFWNLFETTYIFLDIRLKEIHVQFLFYSWDICGLWKKINQNILTYVKQKAANSQFEITPNTHMCNAVYTWYREEDEHLGRRIPIYKECELFCVSC